ncbi:MAG: SAM-dependent methyltransferase, partial [Gammaproteobacteria bacterium]|nr:SAM-dependent methyltransferase [Gammaproteobacteria bacterium]
MGPLFGAVLARALDAWWAALGEPDPFTVIDWGAGPGTLARSVLAAEPGCMAAGALRLVLVELSPAQRALHPELPLVASVGHVSDVLPQSASAGVIVANELLDNLPFDVVRRTADGWEELRVTVEDGASDRFSLVATPAAPELVAGLPE